MRNLVFILLFSYYSTLSLASDTMPGLKNEGGAHFKFSGRYYTFLMSPTGRIGLFPKDYSPESSKWEKGHGTTLSYGVMVNKKGADEFVKYETQSKANRSSFSLNVKAFTESGQMVQLYFSGSDKEWNMAVGFKLPKEYRFRNNFSFSESIQPYLSGTFLGASKELKKKLILPCTTPFDSSSQKIPFYQITLKERLGFNTNIDTLKTKGHLKLSQVSHNKGATLNKEFKISYHNGGNLWNIKENQIKFKFF